MTYRVYLWLVPDDSKARVQLGHCLREMGATDKARAAYEDASRLSTAHADAYFHLANISRLSGSRGKAIENYAKALAVDGDFEDAKSALLAMGQRGKLPERVAAQEETHDNFPISASAAFLSAARRRFCSHPIAEARRETGVEVSASAMWPRVAIVNLDPDFRAPTGLGDGGLDPSVEWCFVVLNGATVEASALDWLILASESQDVGAVYSDYQVDGVPHFQPMYDDLWFADEVGLPIVLISREIFDLAPTLLPCELLRYAHGFAPVSHVPLVLASLDSASGHAEPVGITRSNAPCSTSSNTKPDIQVIIQTRDEVGLLKACVRSVITASSGKSAIDITIVDNRSRHPDTQDFLDSLIKDGLARVIPYDAEFNWSAANNLAASTGSAENILFLNNDVEMLSRNWDCELATSLSAPEIGAVGAMLLYPGGEIQHAGIIMGLNQGHPIHEGLWQLRETGWVAKRWSRKRSAAAVTGAWLGVRRSVFERAGRFDESLPRSYNDVDFCMAVRALDLVVIVNSEIVATHHESATRGLVMTSAQAEEENSHFQRLERRWGKATRFDPGYNPNWIRTGQPFDGLRLPGEAEVRDWIRRSSVRGPWAVRRAGSAWSD